MNILDKRFKYVSAAKTDLAKTFKRIRAEQKANAAEATRKVEVLSERRNPLVANKGNL